MGIKDTESTIMSNGKPVIQGICTICTAKFILFQINVTLCHNHNNDKSYLKSDI